MVLNFTLQTYKKNNRLSNFLKNIFLAESQPEIVYFCAKNSDKDEDANF